MAESDDDLWRRVQREQVWRNNFRGFCLTCGQPAPTDTCDACLEAEHRALVAADTAIHRTERWIVRIAAVLAIAILVWAGTKNETPATGNHEPRPTLPTVSR